MIVFDKINCIMLRLTNVGREFFFQNVETLMHQINLRPQGQLLLPYTIKYTKNTNKKCTKINRKEFKYYKLN